MKDSWCDHFRRRSNVPRHHSAAQLAQPAKRPPPPPPSRQKLFLHSCPESAASQQHVDTATSKAAKPVPRETQPLPFSRPLTGTICKICERVASSSSMPYEGPCCDQEVEAYLVAAITQSPQYHVQASDNAEQPTAQAIAFPPPPMPSRPASQPLHPPLATDSAEPAPEPSPEFFDTVQIPQQHADTASTSAAEPAPAPAPVGSLHQGALLRTAQGLVAISQGLLHTLPDRGCQARPQSSAEQPAHEISRRKLSPVPNVRLARNGRPYTQSELHEYDGRRLKETYWMIAHNEVGSNGTPRVSAIFGSDAASELQM